MKAEKNAVTALFGTTGAANDYARSHTGRTPSARYLHSRLRLVADTLTPVPGGDLLDVGCGPGMMVRELVDSRPGDFRITAMDQSPAMVEECARRLEGTPDARAVVGDVEAMPLPDGSFDVVLAMGVLEYVDVPRALGEIRRVVRPGGRVIVTMLNPHSVYRFVEWHVFWPLLGGLERLEGALGIPPGRRHGIDDMGLRPWPRRALARSLAEAGLSVQDVVHYDVTFLLPPIDRVLRPVKARLVEEPWERTVSRGARRHFGSAYLVVARPS